MFPHTSFFSLSGWKKEEGGFRRWREQDVHSLERRECGVDVIRHTVAEEKESVKVFTELLFGEGFGKSLSPN